MKKQLGKAGWKSYRKIQFQSEMAVCRKYDFLMCQSLIKSNLRFTLNHIVRLFKAWNDFSEIQSIEWYYDSTNKRYHHKPIW